MARHEVLGRWCLNRFSTILMVSSSWNWFPNCQTFFLQPSWPSFCSVFPLSEAHATAPLLPLRREKLSILRQKLRREKLSILRQKLSLWISLWFVCPTRTIYGRLHFFSLVLLLLRESILLRQTSCKPAIASSCFRSLWQLWLSFPIFCVAVTEAMAATAVKCFYCQPGMQQCTNLTLRAQFNNDLIRRSTNAQIRTHRSLVRTLYLFRWCTSMISHLGE